MTSVLDVAKQINRKYKDGKVIVGGDIMPRIPKLKFGSLGAIYPLYGGLPYGAITVFAGQYSSGKSTAAALAMAQYQKENPDKTCVYVDVENTLPIQIDHFVKMTGLQTDPDHFLRYDCSGKSAETIFEDILDLEIGADNIGMIIIDSAAALVSDQDLESDFSKDNGMRASVAKPLGKFIRMMNMHLARKGNILLVINQVREAGKTFTGATIYAEPSGHALDFYPALKVRFGTRTFTQGDKTDIAASKAEDSDGFRLKFAITKSKVSPINRGGGFLTFRFDTGVDIINDTLEVAMKYGFIERPNNMTYLLMNLDTGEVYQDEEGNDLRFVGKAKLIDYIKTHDEFREKYFEMLTRHVDGNNSAGISLLDSDSLSEIMDEEENIESSKKKSKKVEEDLKDINKDIDENKEEN